MKTPDDIKEGLESCVDYYANGCGKQFCDDCPYSENECFQLEKDALVYIQQLESRLAQVERERDAAVQELEIAEDCYNCKYNYACKHDGNGYRKCSECGECPCSECNSGQSQYEWRGVCEENTKEES